MLAKELDLIEKRDVRESVVNRVEVLDRVGNLLLLPSVEYATTEQVSEFYGVGVEAISSIINRHREELDSDGFKVFRKSDVINLLNVQDEQLENKVGKSIITLEDNNIINLPNRGLRLFPKRAILRVGMLLRDSEVAKEIRSRLLDVIHDTERNTPETIEGVVEEISQEKQLMLSRVQAEMDGDYDKVSEINAKLFGLKNKRIRELETENKNIREHKLTIKESRAVIRNIVVNIASSKMNSEFGLAYGKLYNKLNYKLGINIRGRKIPKGKNSMLDTLNEEEMFETEVICRNWASELGLDLEELLKLN